MKKEGMKKRGRGRPRHEIETITMTLRIDADLYCWLKENQGGKSLNQFINDIVRYVIKTGEIIV